jgi:hypothetical protein
MEKEPEKNIYKMELHDSFVINHETRITRVPGGWIYSLFDGYFHHVTFVKFDNEFITDL